MWNNLKSTDLINDSMYYGETICQLSRIVHQSPSLNVTETIFLSSKYFSEYLVNRNISDDIVNDCIIQLNKIGILEKEEIIFSISVWKNCNMNPNPIIVKNSHSNIKNAINKLYERWFDGKPYSYRIAHQLNQKETYPSIYVQSQTNAKIHSLITRHPVSGKLMLNEEWRNIVHCSVSPNGEKEKHLIKKIDELFISPQKVFFYYKHNTQELIISKIDNYPMKQNAYLYCLAEKHQRRIISSKTLLEYINPSDIVYFQGYKLSAKNLYKGICVSYGNACGKAVFQNSNWDTILNNSDDSYILFIDYSTPENIDMLKHCRGAIICRGGKTSHEAVICRGMGIPAIADSRINIDLEKKEIHVGNKTIREGDQICISGIDELWAENGIFEPYYKLNLDENPLNYLIRIINSIRDKKQLTEYSLKFQMHFSKIVNALKKTGYVI